MSKRVPFQTIQFTIRTLPGQSGPGSDGNEGVLCIFLSSSFTGTSPSYCLASYLEHTLGWGLNPLQLVYSTAPVQFQCQKQFHFKQFSLA